MNKCKKGAKFKVIDHDLILQKKQRLLDEAEQDNGADRLIACL